MNKKSYFNNWMDIEFNVYPLNDLRVYPDPMELSDWLTEVYNVYSHNLPIFQKLNRIDVWDTDRPDCPSIKNYAGLCYPDGHIELAHTYTHKGTLSHEFGHWVSMGTMVAPWGDSHGKMMWDLYVGLRGQDFTSRTPSEERWAEDFRNFFGCLDVRGVINPDDDCLHPDLVGKKVRSPFEVNGLKDFMYGFKQPLDFWRKNGSISSVTYNSGCWMWKRKYWWLLDRWESFMGGTFYYWNGSAWKQFQ